MEKIAVVTINQAGRDIADILKKGFSESRIYLFSAPGGRLKNLAGRIFDRDKFEGIIFIMALGIAVRLIAPYLKDKYRDPAVVVVDDKRRFAISVVCGHEGGANRLAVCVSNILDAEPVITTASEADKNLIIGIGCRKRIKKEEVIRALKWTVSKIRHSLSKVKYIATIDLKKDEKGLLDACLELEIPLRIISIDLVQRFKGRYHRSAFVQRKIGLWGVCEPCALLAGKRTELILSKTKLNGIAIAVSREC